MNSAQGFVLDADPLQSMEKVRDLEYYNGPLLTELRSVSGDSYLKYWCDADHDANRWVIARVSQVSIIKLMARKRPLRDVLTKDVQDPFVYIVDISENSVYATVSRSVPDEYLPSAGALLPSLAKDSFVGYPILLDGEWDVDQFANMPRLFGDVYSLLYFQNKQPSARFMDLPWRGGFSAMHFFKDIRAKVPTTERPRVQSVQYASPGFMRFSGDGNVCAQVAKAVGLLKSNEQEVAREYGALNLYIREEKLNDPAKTVLDFTPGQLEFLERHGEGLAKALRSIDWGWIKSNAPDVFQAAKVVKAHCSRLRDLDRMEKDGLIQFVE